MLRSLASLAVASLLVACYIDDGGAEYDYFPYDIQVDWTTPNPPSGEAVATITTPEETLEVRSFSGSVRMEGEVYENDVEVCVGLARLYYQTINGQPIPIYEPLSQQCEHVPPGRRTVAFRF